MLVGVIAVGAWELVARDDAPTVLDHGTVPAFTLTERSGATVTSDDLADDVWIADFIFTRCGGTCPILSSRLAALLARLRDRGLDHIRAVSISVDPEFDDPARLTSYAERYDADPERWLFLTGTRPDVERLVQSGFHLSIAKSTDPGTLEPITHSDRFVLVDRGLQIRGYYHGTSPEDVATLEAELARMAGGGS